VAKSGQICYDIKMYRQKNTKTPWAIALCATLLTWVSTVSAQQTNGSVGLIQPLDDSTASLASSPTIFIDYFNMSRFWLFRVAVGFTVLWILIGGVMFMTSGNNQSRRSAAISRIIWSVVGLLILLFSGVILRTLNSLFFIR